MTTRLEAMRWADAKIAEYQKAIADLEAFKRVAASEEAPLVGGTQERRTRGLLSDAPLGAAIMGIDFDANRRGAKKHAILKALADHPNGLSTSQIILRIAERGITGSTVENTSPQISGYREAGLVTLSSGLWSITPGGRKALDAYEQGAHQ